MHPSPQERRPSPQERRLSPQERRLSPQEKAPKSARKGAQDRKRVAALLLEPPPRPNTGGTQIIHHLRQILQTRPPRRGRLQNWRKDTCSGSRIPLFSSSTQTIVAKSANRERWRRKFTEGYSPLSPINRSILATPGIVHDECPRAWVNSCILPSANSKMPLGRGGDGR